jgi:O-antigen/teichoic acid export membrane protein
MIKKLLNQYQNSERIRQVLALFSVNILVIPISFVSNIIITRFLGPVAFGDFKFILNVFGFSVVLFNFGFFQACNRALVVNTEFGKSREYYGSMLVILGAMFLVISCILVIYAFVDHNIQEKGLRTSLLYVIPFTWTFLLNSYFEVLFQADNKIGLLAKSRIYPRIAFFISILILYLFLNNYSGNRLSLIWLFYLVTQIIAYFYIIAKVNPSFKNLRERIKEIWYYNKTYGFNVYSGALFDTGFGQLSALLIGYFGVDNSGVGFFALALTISEPLGFIPNVIATTHYRDFSTRNSIPRRLILITVGVTLTALILNWILVGPFVRYFYSPKFYPVISLTYIASIGVLMNGFGDFFNRFLGSHGQGKALRNSAIIVGSLIFVLNLVLIPMFMEQGAAYTKICAGFAYFAIMYWFYRSLTTRLRTQNI